MLQVDDNGGKVRYLNLSSGSMTILVGDGLATGCADGVGTSVSIGIAGIAVDAKGTFAIAVSCT